MALRFVPDPNILVSAAVKPNGVSAEVVRAALDEAFRFVVCPHLVGELRRVLARERFRNYLSRDEAELLIDAIEAVAEVVPDPESVPRVSTDPDDDYLIALARRESVEGIISGDPDLDVQGGPPRLTSGDALHRLHLGPTDRQLLVGALWDLHLRIGQATAETEDPELAAFLEDVHSASRTLGGDPDVPLFGLPALPEKTVRVTDLDLSERTACAYALELDRRTTGRLHAEHVDEVERLSSAFEIMDRYSAIERLLAG